jgi:transketolase
MTTTVSAEKSALPTLDIKSKLAPAPKGLPKYSVKIKNSAGKEVVIADPRATRAIVALMDMHAVIGGAACHWGGPAAMAEVMASIHAIMFSVKDRPWFDVFNFVNDAGHTENGVYALRANYGFDGMAIKDMRGFRSIQSKFTGHGESHINPQGVLLSNGPLGSSLPQAQGMAMADKAAGRDRLTFVVVSDGAAMEGEAKESFAAVPGFAAKGMVNPFVMAVSDNNTKLSGRIDKDSFAMKPTFDAMRDLGWKIIDVPRGNDLQAVFLAVEDAVRQARADAKKPVCIWLHTVKGFSVKATEAESSGGHAFPLKDAAGILDFVNEIYSGSAPEEFASWACELKDALDKKKAAVPAAAPAGPKKEKVQEGLARAAIRAAKEGFPVVSISADLAGSTGIKAFQKEFPARTIDCGVAEANMVSTAAGFSKAGFIPIVDTFAQFGVTKGNLPLTMAAQSQAPVIAVFSHVGFQDAADGASHQATTYIAAVSAIPHTVAIACSCSAEADAFLYEAIRRQSADRKAGKDGESCVFFVGRENYPQCWVDGQKFEWGKAQVLRQGADVVIAACGSLVGHAIEAGKLLAKDGIDACIINNPFVNRVDTLTLGWAVSRAGGRLVTVEDHQIIGGMGAQMVHALTRMGAPVRAVSLGIDGHFGQSAYKSDQLYEKHGLTAPHQAAAAKKLLGK